MIHVLNQGFINEISQRLTEDSKKLKKFSLIHTKKGKIKKINKMGDSHEGGRSVVLLTLKHEKKVQHLIYKPRCIKIEKAFEQFLRWVNEKTNLNLQSPRSYSRQGYGWCEYIQSKACQTKKEVATYYKKLGALMGVALFLRATDIHHENIIACGDTPYIVDYETFFTPQLSEQHDPHWVVYTAMLPRWRKTSITTKWVDKSAFSGFYDDLKQKHSHIPMLKNMRVNPYDYVSNFLSGFKKIFNFFINYKTTLLQDVDSPLTAFKDVSTRIVLKDTACYYEAIKQERYEGFSPIEVFALKQKEIPIYQVMTNSVQVFNRYLHKIPFKIVRSGYANVSDFIQKYANREHFLFQFNMIKQCLLIGFLNYRLCGKSNLINNINKKYCISKLSLINGYWMLVRAN